MITFGILLFLAGTFAGLMIIIDYKNKNGGSWKNNIIQLSRINFQPSRTPHVINWYSKYYRKHGIKAYRKITEMKSKKGKIIRNKVRSIFETSHRGEKTPSHYISQVQEIKN